MRTLSLSILATAFTLAACGASPEAAPVTPAPAPAAPEAPAPEPAAAAPAPEPAAPAPAPEPPPAPLKEQLGTVKSIEVLEVDLTTGPKSTRTYSKAAEVEAILKAINLEQAATGPNRRCPDDITVYFRDEAGADKGMLGLCGALSGKDDVQGAEFVNAAGKRGGVTLADAPALKKALAKAPPGKPKKAADAKATGAKATGDATKAPDTLKTVPDASPKKP
jgi:2-oxoglutarate dehydrogenase E2 component (dihydrolipoamide succinyltransferase)